MKKLALTALMLFIISFSSQSYALTNCIQIPILPDNPVWNWEDFAVDYHSRTNEYVGTLATNVQETHYLFCSARMTQQVADQLDVDYPMIIITPTGARPTNWETKEIRDADGNIL